MGGTGGKGGNAGKPGTVNFVLLIETKKSVLYFCNFFSSQMFGKTAMPPKSCKVHNFLFNLQDRSDGPLRGDGSIADLYQ